MLLNSLMDTFVKSFDTAKCSNSVGCLYRLFSFLDILQMQCDFSQQIQIQGVSQLYTNTHYKRIRGHWVKKVKHSILLLYYKSKKYSSVNIIIV